MILYRSPTEIAFRLRQEFTNARLRWGAAGAAPELTSLPFPQPGPVAESLRGSALEQTVVHVAEAALRRQFPLLGGMLDTGNASIRWRRDYERGIETPPAYFRRVPYLDVRRTGDHKLIWELNRHQHLVAQAQAYLFTGRQVFLDDLWQQLESWLEQNPFCRGMNWTSALEVAFRALSWLWIEHFAGEHMPVALRPRWTQSLFQHGQFLANNLSFYFSPNTHLQGEALALHALGAAFRQPAWRSTGAAVLRDLVRTHARNDGSHFEQSSYYHVYSLDMFLLHALLQPVDEAYRAKLRLMARYLWALAGPGEIPLLGDDDGGRLFHPYGNRRAFGRATLATCAAFLGDTPWHGDPRDLHEQAAWWMGPGPVPPATEQPLPQAHWFPDAGVAVLASPHPRGAVQLVADTRGFGYGGAGHSHAHALHFTLRVGRQDVLTDPGTFTYVGDPEARNAFRGTAFHNTVSVDGLDQAEPAGPFRWNALPETTLLQITPPHGEPPAEWHLHAACAYRGVVHKRFWIWCQDVLFVVDHLTSRDKHEYVQWWHAAGAIETRSAGQFALPGGVRLLLPETAAASIVPGWGSPSPGAKVPLPVIRVAAPADSSCVFAAAFLLPGVQAEAGLKAASSEQGIELTAADRRAALQWS